MISMRIFMPLFLFANIKYFDLWYGVTKLQVWPALSMLIITYGLAASVWMLFPRSRYAT